MEVRTDATTGERYLAIFVRGEDILRDPMLNKGTAFTIDERDTLGLRGLLPDRVESLDEQLERVRMQFDLKTTDMGKNVYLNGLLDRNETLFYKFVEENLEEVIPVVYTPTVAYACRHWSQIYRRQRGIYITKYDRGRIAEILRARPVMEPPVIVVTDNERILGIGDQGAGGMGIPIGKLALYTAGAGIHPERCMPVSIDVGTNNAELLDDPLYVGVREPRMRGAEYDELVDEFVDAVRQEYPGALLQWEDFANLTSFRHLATHRRRLASFNDDIQGTAAMVVAGLTSVMAHLGDDLVDSRVVIAGAGSAGHGISQQIQYAMVAAGADPAEAAARIFVLDSRGLVVEGPHLKDHKVDLATPQSVVDGWGDVATPPNLLDVVRNVRPNVLVGVTGKAGRFTETVVREMAAHTERPLILPLSNPTNLTEIIPAAALEWTHGRAIVATGSPFSPVIHGGKVHRIGQANNSFIFPGMGLAVITVRASEITDGMFLAAARALAEETPAELIEQGQIYPNIDDVRSVSYAVAVAVARQAIEEGVADPVEDLETAIRDGMWEPEYLPMRPE